MIHYPALLFAAWYIYLLSHQTAYSGPVSWLIVKASTRFFEESIISLCPPYRPGADRRLEWGSETFTKKRLPEDPPSLRAGGHWLQKALSWLRPETRPAYNISEKQNIQTGGTCFGHFSPATPGHDDDPWLTHLQFPLSIYLSYILYSSFSFCHKRQRK